MHDAVVFISPFLFIFGYDAVAILMPIPFVMVKNICEGRNYWMGVALETTGIKC